MNRAVVLAFGLTLAGLISSASQAYATGLTAHVEDDRHQFVDLYEADGNIVLKVSNGRKFRPMWLEVTAQYYEGERLVHTERYGVYCPAPSFGGGQERYFTFPGVTGTITKVVLHSNKRAPWSVPEAGWTPTIPIYNSNGIVPTGAIVNANPDPLPAEPVFIEKSGKQAPVF